MAAQAPERPEIELTTRDDLGFLKLVWWDYRAATYNSGRRESKLAAALAFLPRLLFNPSLQFALLVRVGQKGPGILMYPVRWLQVVFFSSEVWWFRGDSAIVIGPGVTFPHPINVLVGPGTMIGEGVMIYNNTQIGADRSYEVGQGEEAVAARATHIGDRSIVYAYGVVQGPFNIGEDAVVGLRVVVDDHVPPGALMTPKRLRRAGEWSGNTGSRWPGLGDG